MRMPVRIILVLLLTLAPAAHAGTLYKCSGAKGAVTIQSDPCPAGSTEIWKRDSAPAPQPTLQQVVANATSPAATAGTGHTPAPGAPASAPVPSAATPPSMPPPPAVAPVPPAVAPPPPGAMPPPASTPSTITLQWHDEPETPAGQATPDSACDSAKVFANSVREKIWLNLSQDQMQSLYNWVLNECDQR